MGFLSLNAHAHARVPSQDCLESHPNIQRDSREVCEGDRARVQVVLHVAPLVPRLPDLPVRRSDDGRPEDVRRARLPVRSAVQHVRAVVDVVHLRAWREAEAEARWGARAVVCAL